MLEVCDSFDAHQGQYQNQDGTVALAVAQPTKELEENMMKNWLGKRFHTSREARMETRRQR
jgi:hypothetical protein